MRARPGPATTCAKIAYPSQVDALIALKAQELRANHVEGVVPLRAYRCRRCSRWHLTSKTRGATR